MAESEESDEHRLAGRLPRHMRAPGPDDDPSADEEDDDEDGENQLDAVNRLLGFLRSTD